MYKNTKFNTNLKFKIKTNKGKNKQTKEDQKKT